MKINMISKEELADLIDVSKLKDMTAALSNVKAIEALKNLRKDDVVVVEKKKCSWWKCLLVIVLVVAAIGGIAYALIKYFKPEYEDEFMDDIDDEFEDDDDDLFEDDELKNK